MKNIHVSHRTTGFEEVDRVRGIELYNQIRKEDTLVFPATFTYMGVPVEGFRNDKPFIVDSNLFLLSQGTLDELWVYGPIDERMEKEIHIAYAKRIYIRCKDARAEQDFAAMGLTQKEHNSELRFWIIFTILALIATVLFFILFRWNSQA